MGFLDQLAKKALGQIVPGIADKVVSTAQNKTREVSFPSLPQNVEQLKALPQADMLDPYNVAALVVVALTLYETSKEECFRMLDFLKGPEDTTVRDKQFLIDRLGGKQYIVNSFFKGAAPSNDYKAAAPPYTVTVKSNPYSFQNKGWATLYLVSGGADSPRNISLRQKQSTGQWFLYEMSFLGDIRKPVSSDPWA